MYCRHCGNPIPNHAAFCATCGTPTAHKQSISEPAPPTILVTTYQKKRKIKWLLLIVGVLLLILSAGYMALSVIGSSTTAQVTDYEQRIFINNDDSSRNPNRYEIYYEFNVKGERYSGSITRVFEGGSHMRNTIAIRYLPMMPSVNGEDSFQAGFAGPIMLLLGVFIIYVSFHSK